MLLPVISCGRCYVFILSVWTRYLSNCLSQFQQIYNLSAGRDKYELIRFWGQKGKGQRSMYSQTKYSPISTSGAYLTNRWWAFRPIYHLGALGDKDRLIIFWGQKVKVTMRVTWPKITCTKCILWWRRAGLWFTNEDHLTVFLCLLSGFNICPCSVMCILLSVVCHAVYDHSDDPSSSCCKGWLTHMGILDSLISEILDWQLRPTHYCCNCWPTDESWFL